MTRFIVPVLTLLATGCATEPADSFDGEAVKGTKYDVCHNTDDGDYHVINISSSAVDSHIANHGDWLVTDEVCGDGVDNDCDGEVDEDCCPCWTYDELVAHGQQVASHDVWDASCYDGYYFEPWDYVVLGEGYSSDGSYDYVGAGVSIEDSYVCLIEGYDESTSLWTIYDFDLTEGEADSCYDILSSYAAAVGLECTDL